MPSIQVHAGNYKTGSTAIQAVLLAMRERLARRGILMPGLDPHDSKHVLANHELSGPRRSATPRLDRILADINQSPSDSRHILTNETFIDVEPARLRNFLARTGADWMGIYFYVRPHAGLLVSLYLQAVKNGFFAGTPEQFAQRKEKKAPYDFMASIDGFSTTFGARNVHVREFSRDTFKDGSLIADLWEFMNLPKKMLPRALGADAVQNPTPRAEVAEILRSLTARLMAHDGRRTTESARSTVFGIFRSFNDHAPDLPCTPYRLSVELQEKLAETFAADRAVFAQRYFHQPPSPAWLHEPVTAPHPPIDPPHELVADIIAKANTRAAGRGRAAYAELCEAWLQDAPTTTTAGVRTIDITELAHRTNLAAPPLRKIASE